MTIRFDKEDDLFVIPTIVISKKKVTMKEYIEVMIKIYQALFECLYEAAKTFFMAIGISYGLWIYVQSKNIGVDYDIIQVALTIYIIYISVMVLLKLTKKTIAMEKECSPVETSFEENNRDEIENVCAHEAGHALMYYLINRKDIRVYINVPVPYTKVSFQKSCVSSVQYLQENVMACYASIAAQRILDKESNGFYGEESSRADMTMANHYLHDLLFITNHNLSLTGDDDETRQEMSRLSKELYAKTEHVLREHIDELKEITVFLLKHRTADKNDIRKICEKGNK